MSGVGWRRSEGRGGGQSGEVVGPGGLGWCRAVRAEPGNINGECQLWHVATAAGWDRLTLPLPLSSLVCGSHVRTTVSSSPSGARTPGLGASTPTASPLPLRISVQLTLRGRKLSGRLSFTPVPTNPPPTSTSSLLRSVSVSGSGSAAPPPPAGDSSAGEGGPFCCLLAISRPRTFRTDSSDTRAAARRPGRWQRDRKEAGVGGGVGGGG